MNPLQLRANPIQTAFNNLALPIIWIGDSPRNAANTNVQSSDILVHPYLSAINEYQRHIGKPTIDPIAMAANGMEYVQSRNDGTSIQHPILARDMATRGQPIYQFDSNILPEGAYRDATKVLVQAVGLAELYYHMQVEPKYVEQLRLVAATGDVEKLQHFWLRGHLGDIETKISNNQTAGIVLPEETRTHNGIWWPAEFTKDDIESLREAPWEDPLLKRKIFSTESRIIPASANEPDSFLHNGKYYKPASLNTCEELKIVGAMIADRLIRAAEILQNVDPEYSEMLKGRARHITSDDLFRSLDDDLLWSKASNEFLSFSLGRQETYAMFGDPFGIKSHMQASLGYIDPAQLSFVVGVVELMPKAHEALLALWNDNENIPFNTEQRPVPSVEIVNLIISGGIVNGTSYVPGGFNQPNLDGYETEVTESEAPKRLVLFAQIMQQRITSVGLPVANNAFDAETVAKISNEGISLRALIAAVESHEIAHSLGVPIDESMQVFGTNRFSTLKNLYGEKRATSWEEGKADLIGMYNSLLYTKEGKLSEDELHATSYAYLGSMLRAIYLGENDEHGLGSIYNWALLIKHGVIKENSGKLHFNLENFLEVLPAMSKEYLEMYGSANTYLIEEFHAHAMAQVANDTIIGKAVAKAKTAGGPSDNRPYYVVENL